MQIAPSGMDQRPSLDCCDTWPQFSSVILLYSFLQPSVKQTWLIHNHVFWQRNDPWTYFRQVDKNKEGIVTPYTAHSQAVIGRIIRKTVP